VRKDLPPTTLQEFTEYAKTNESKLNMAHAGVGSVSHVGCLLLNAAIGIKPTMVPFTGTGPAMNAIIAGQVDFVCDPILGPLPHVRAGTVKALAIAANKRNALLPEVPTSAEGGLPQFMASPFYALFAPRGTPQQIILTLADALNKGLNEDFARKRLLELGAEVPEPSRRGPEALRALVKSEIARLTPILGEDPIGQRRWSCRDHNDTATGAALHAQGDLHAQYPAPRRVPGSAGLRIDRARSVDKRICRESAGAQLCAG
jgi:tripartite-type tricarboxylate transporter receptor subunit TctC